MNCFIRPIMATLSGIAGGIVCALALSCVIHVPGLTAGIFSFVGALIGLVAGMSGTINTELEDGTFLLISYRNMSLFGFAMFGGSALFSAAVAFVLAMVAGLPSLGLLSTYLFCGVLGIGLIGAVSGLCSRTTYELHLRYRGERIWCP